MWRWALPSSGGSQVQSRQPCFLHSCSFAVAWRGVDGGCDTIGRSNCSCSDRGWLRFLWPTRHQGQPFGASPDSVPAGLHEPLHALATTDNHQRHASAFQGVGGRFLPIIHSTAIRVTPHSEAVSPGRNLNAVNLRIRIHAYCIGRFALGPICLGACNECSAVGKFSSRQEQWGDSGEHGVITKPASSVSWTGSNDKN